MKIFLPQIPVFLIMSSRLPASVPARPRLPSLQKICRRSLPLSARSHPLCTTVRSLTQTILATRPPCQQLLASTPRHRRDPSLLMLLLRLLLLLLLLLLHRRRRTSKPHPSPSLPNPKTASHHRPLRMGGSKLEVDGNGDRSLPISGCNSAQLGKHRGSSGLVERGGGGGTVSLRW